MTHPSRFAAVLCACLGLFLPVRSGAQSSSALLVAPDQRGLVGVPSPRTPSAWRLEGTVMAGYASRPIGIYMGALVEHRIETTLAAQLGLWSRGALALRLPVLLDQHSDGAPLVGADSEVRYRSDGTYIIVPTTHAIRKRALGNPALDARVRIAEAAQRDLRLALGGGRMGELWGRHTLS